MFSKNNRCVNDKWKVLEFFEYKICKELPNVSKLFIILGVFKTKT